MKTADGFQQTYNAQAAVEIGSRLIPSASLRAGFREAVTDAPNDKEQLLPTLAATSPEVESVGAVLIDSGFYSAAAVVAAEQSHGGKPAPKIFAATGRQPHGRTVAQLEQRTDPPEPGADASARQIMEHRLAPRAGRTLYAQRKQTTLARLRHRQSGTGVPPVQPARAHQSAHRMVAGHAGLQPQPIFPPRREAPGGLNREGIRTPAPQLRPRCRPDRV